MIAKVSNDMANQDLVSFISLIALISINLGLINLFPLPLLDGGHFLHIYLNLQGTNKLQKNFINIFRA